jgi:hypothetical protein
MYTTEAAVIDALSEDYDGSVPPSVESCILIAAELVEEVCTPAGYSTGRLALIEMYLAAHFYLVSRPKIESESIGGEITTKIQGRTDLLLLNTFHGQSALMLDTEGGLAEKQAQAAGKTTPGKNVNTQTAGIVWLGTARDSTGRAI